jgi:stage V sporulation protein S
MGEIARVKSNTDSNKLAGYIAHVFENGAKEHFVDCIGPAAVNQAIKAQATASGILAPKGIDIAVKAHFFETKTNDADAELKTGIRIKYFRI